MTHLDNRPRLPVLAIILLQAVACAPAAVRLPAGPAAPMADVAAVFDEATKECRSVRTLTAEIAVTGRVSGRRVRGRVFAGLALPDSMRLEGLAPFGPPAFVLVASGGHATLFLPRDDRVLNGAPAPAILEALTGVPLSPEELLAVLSGCGADGSPNGGRRYGTEWEAIDVDTGATLYMRPTPARHIVAATTRTFSVEYRPYQGRLPDRVQVRTNDSTPADRLRADLTLTLSQMGANEPLDPAAFTVRVPDTAVPLTLEELRERGLLGLAN